MNTPIIKPSLIYLINLCDNFKTALFIVMLVAGFVVVVSLYEYLNEEEEQRYFSKRFKILIVALISSLAVNIALPSEKDLLHNACNFTTNTAEHPKRW